MDSYGDELERYKRTRAALEQEHAAYQKRLNDLFYPFEVGCGVMAILSIGCIVVGQWFDHITHLVH